MFSSHGYLERVIDVRLFRLFLHGCRVSLGRLIFLGEN